MGPEESESWTGSTEIKSGVYIWDVREVREGFLAWADFPGNDWIKNYDTYVDTKFEEVASGDSCSGLAFRKSALGWETGGYAFLICSTGHYEIHYRNAKGWQEIHTEYNASLRPFNWNRIEVLIRGNHFIFLINNQVVYETDDNRQPVGGVALVINVEEGGTKILFDNFGYQSRYNNPN